MAAFDFPSSPTLDQEFTPIEGLTYIWNGTAWVRQPEEGGGGAGIAATKVTQFLVNGTWTVDAKCIYAVLDVWGGGGAGGGAPATTVGTNRSAGAGGNGGAHVRKSLNKAALAGPYAVTVGAGGTGVTSAAGGAGGASSVGALISAIGGEGGTAGTVSATPLATVPASTTSTSVGDAVASTWMGDPGLVFSATFSVGGHGGNTDIGGAGKGGATSVGTAARANSGAGGGGAMSGSGVGTANAGATGGSGQVVITEFLSA